MTPARQKLELKDGVDGLFEQKRLGKPFKVTSTDDKGLVEGHGAVFDDPHPTSSWALDFDWSDVIKPGAFSRTLSEHKKRGTTPVMLFMHQRGNVPGAWRDVAEDGDGLKLAGQVSPNALTPSGVGLHELLKMGAITGLSIGFRVRKATLNEEEKVREILDIDLSEVSIVDIPGGPSARITDVKTCDPKFLESVLRDAGLSRKEAKAFMAKGFDALRDAAAEPVPDLRDAGRSVGGSAWLRSMVDRAAKLKT